MIQFFQFAFVEADFRDVEARYLHNSKNKRSIKYNANQGAGKPRDGQRRINRLSRRMEIDEQFFNGGSSRNWWLRSFILHATYVSWVRKYINRDGPENEAEIPSDASFAFRARDGLHLH